MKRHISLLVLMLMPVLLWAQWQTDDSPLKVQVSTGVVVGKGAGDWQSMQWVAPSIKLQATPRLTVMGGFATGFSLIPPDAMKGKAHSVQDLAPRKDSPRVNAMWLAASYQASDRLWLWGAVAHSSGTLQPLWTDNTLPVGVTAFSGGLAWKMTDSQLLEVHFHFVRDSYGTAAFGPMGHPWYAPHTPSMGFYNNMWAW